MRLFFSWAWLAIACTVVAAGCVRLDQNHCANQGNPGQYCRDEHGFAYCSACLSEKNGCRVDQPGIDCDAGESAADTSDATTTSGGMTTTSSSMSATMSSTSVDPTTTEPTMTMTEPMDSTTGDVEPGCGNGVVEESIGENCEEGMLPLDDCSDVSLTGGMLGCYPPGHELECKYDLTQCMGVSQCGNSDIEGTEQCDLLNLNMQTCETLSEDYIGGTLTCTGPKEPNECTFNTSGCLPCGMNGDPCTVSAECCGGNLCLLENCL